MWKLIDGFSNLHKWNRPISRERCVNVIKLRLLFSPRLFVCLFWFLLSLWSKSMDSDWKEIHSIYIRGYCESSVDLSMHSGARMRIGVISIANHEWATQTWNFQWVCSQSSDVRIANRKVFFILQQNDLKRCTNAIFFEMFQFCTAAFFRVCVWGNLSVP